MPPGRETSQPPHPASLLLTSILPFSNESRVLHLLYILYFFMQSLYGSNRSNPLRCLDKLKQRSTRREGVGELPVCRDRRVTCRIPLQSNSFLRYSSNVDIQNARNTALPTFSATVACNAHQAKGASVALSIDTTRRNKAKALPSRAGVYIN